MWFGFDKFWHLLLMILKPPCPLQDVQAIALLLFMQFGVYNFWHLLLMILKPPCPVQDVQAISKECSRLAPVSSSLRLKVFTFSSMSAHQFFFVSQESKKADFLNLCTVL
jgi:hypothetical protein